MPLPPPPRRPDPDHVPSERELRERAKELDQRERDAERHRKTLRLKEDEVSRLTARVRELEGALAATRDELASTSTQLAEAHASPRVLVEGDYSTLGPRISQILTLAEEEAAALRSTAQDEAEELRRVTHEQTTRLRERTEAECTRTTEEARAEATALVAGAKDEAAAILEHAQQESRVRREEASARHEEAVARSAQLVGEVERDLAARREAVLSELEGQRTTQAERQAAAEARIEATEAEADTIAERARTRADEVLARARREADTLLSEARARVERIRRDGEREIAALTERREAVSSQLAHLRGLLGAVGGSEEVPAPDDAPHEAANAEPSQGEDPQAARERALVESAAQGRFPYTGTARQQPAMVLARLLDSLVPFGQPGGGAGTDGTGVERGALAALDALALADDGELRTDLPAQRRLTTAFDAFVEFRKVWLAYNEQLLRENHFAVEAIDLKVRQGEFIAIVGPSGCGKSTLLRMIAGLESITGGTLEIDGHRMNEVPPSQRGIAMVFQSYALFANRTARQNIAEGLTVVRGMPQAQPNKTRAFFPQDSRTTCLTTPRSTPRSLKPTWRQCPAQPQRDRVHRHRLGLPRAWTRGCSCPSRSQWRCRPQSLPKATRRPFCANCPGSASGPVAEPGLWMSGSSSLLTSTSS